jgi:hypothetical protein
MEIQTRVYMEAATTLLSLVDEYIDRFGFLKRKKTKDGKEIVNLILERRADNLLSASSIEEWDYESIVASTRRTIDAMRDIEYECSGTDLSAYKDRRRNVEKILSIMHIGKTYHEDAIKRLKKIRVVKIK